MALVSFIRSSKCDHCNCVEVGHAAQDGAVYVRNSKEPDCVLKIEPLAWNAFLAWLKTPY
ncbi:DUF397 domain-containing protein [Micromonospora sp. FIMYZ51]|uniref:DUF397 domain-containing protein n=1 Tax=Micromonospora sp. FIMYZ51 TaxID=3051832 RepID=UPI0031205330